MRRGTLVAIRHRADGSLYFHKKTPFWSALRESFAIVLFIVIALLLLELAIFKSSATAQVPNRPVTNSVITLSGFRVSNETPHADLVNAGDNPLITETKTCQPVGLPDDKYNCRTDEVSNEVSKERSGHYAITRGIDQRRETS